MKKTNFILLLIFIPSILSGQVITGASGKMVSSFDKQGDIEYGAGIKLSAGYAFNNWLEVDVQAQRYWVSSILGNNINTLSLHGKFIPLSYYLKPYIGFGAGIGILQADDLIVNDNGATSIDMDRDIWLFKPKIGFLADTEILNNLVVDFNVFYEINKYQDYNEDFNMYGVSLGLKYYLNF